MSPQMIERLWQAFLDTALMVGVSAGIAVLAGIPLALFLVTSGPGGIFPAPVARGKCSPQRQVFPPEVSVF